MDSERNKRFLVGRLIYHRRKKQKLQTLVQWKGYPQSYDSWKTVDALRDVCRLRAVTPVAPAPLSPNVLAEAAYLEEEGGMLPPTSYARAPARSSFSATAALPPQGVDWYVAGMLLRNFWLFHWDTIRQELGRYGQAAFLLPSTYRRRHNTYVRLLLHALRAVQ